MPARGFPSILQDPNVSSLRASSVQLRTLMVMLGFIPLTLELFEGCVHQVFRRKKD
jgi:hypothetical protein